MYDNIITVHKVTKKIGVPQKYSTKHMSRDEQLNYYKEKKKVNIYSRNTLRH